MSYKYLINPCYIDLGIFIPWDVYGDQMCDRSKNGLVEAQYSIRFKIAGVFFSKS